MKVFKKTVSMLLALILVLSVFAVVPMAASAEESDTLTVYFTPNSNWAGNTTRFSIYAYVGEDNNWYDLTAVDGEANLYSADIAAKYTTIIFCAMNPDTTANDWDNNNKWNQSANIEVESGKNYFTLGTDGDGWNNLNGTWSTYTPAEPVEPETFYFAPNADWKSDGARFAIYVYGDNGDAWADMTKINSNLYSYQIPTGDWNKIIFCRMNPAIAENGWEGIRWNQSADQDLPTSEKPYFIMETADTWTDAGAYAADCAVVAGHTISLKDEIGVNFYLWVSEGYQDATVSFKWGSGEYQKTAEGTLATATETGTTNAVSCFVAARSMTDKVTVTLTKDGNEILTDSYSVADYSEQAATAYGDDEPLKNLLCDMLDYGAAVQEYFGYNTDDKASDYISKVMSTWTRRTAPGSLVAANSLKTASLSGMEYAGATLSAASKTTIRLYFTITDIDAVPADVTLKDSKKADLKYIEISDIAAKDVFTNKTVTIGGTNYTYNAGGYYNSIIAGDYADSLKAVMKAMYNYSMSAAAYPNYVGVDEGDV